MQRVHDSLWSFGLLLLIGITHLHCGGSHTASPVPPPAPVITSFTASKDLVPTGTSVMLTAKFTGGTGVISNGVGKVSSDSPIDSGPITSSTSYTLVVTNSAGVSVSATAAVTVGALGAFLATGDMTTARWGHTATLLSNGKVLISGGVLEHGTPPGYGTSLSSAELYDPQTGTFTPTGSTNSSWGNPVATLLSNGKVLITGINMAEVYDPATGQFTATGTSESRLNHTATLLPNGKVLLCGGWNIMDPMNALLSTAELFDPISGTFTATSPMTTGRTEHQAFLLPSGKVLIVGGKGSYSNTILSVEVYDPNTGKFSALGTIPDRIGTDMTRYVTGMLLMDGKILLRITGYSNLYTSIFDPNTNSFFPFNPQARLLGNCMLLKNGKILSFSYMNSAVLDLTTNSIQDTGIPPDGAVLSGNRITLLDNGKLLITGGVSGASVRISTKNAYIYDPTLTK